MPIGVPAKHYFPVDSGNDADHRGGGRAYSYDEFGNLTDVTTTKGSTPELHTGYDPATNHGACADGNGNTPSGCSYTYGYAPGNKRMWRADGATKDEMTFWSVSGQKLAVYHLTVVPAVGPRQL